MGATLTGSAASLPQTSHLRRCTHTHFCEHVRTSAGEHTPCPSWFSFLSPFPVHTIIVPVFPFP